MQRKHRSSTLTLTIIMLLAVAVSSLPLDVNADPCEEMEKEGLLLYQQFQNGKVCKASGIRKDLTDCSFKVGSTEILLAGAIGKTREERMFGSSGSGFHVLSVDPSVTVSVFADKDFGLMVRIQEKPNATGISCMSNEAYITLDAQILNPEQINEIKYGTLPQSASDKDRMKYVQENLNLLGYQITSVDGLLGPQTKRALEAYKRDKQLEQDVPNDEVYKLIAEDTYLKILNELKRLTAGMGKPLI